MLSYNSEMTRVHNGYASARLDYATGSEGNAYIGLNYAIPSNYDQLNFWVYGDNSGAQLALVTDTGMREPRSSELLRLEAPDGEPRHGVRPSRGMTVSSASRPHQRDLP